MNSKQKFEAERLRHRIVEAQIQERYSEAKALKAGLDKLLNEGKKDGH